MVGISLALALLGSEVTLRGFNYRPGTLDPEMFVKNDRALLPFKLRANYQGYCAGKEVKIDADGYRIVQPSYDQLYAGKPGRPDRVILLLGDSGVFGFGVGDQETIASQLQTASFKRNLNYQIKNIGVNGYTSWNEYAALDEYLKKNTATDAIVLYMPNDLTFDNDYFGIAQGKSASFSGEESRLHDLTRFLYQHVYTTYLIADGAKRSLSSIDATAAAAVGFDVSRKQKEIDYSMEALQKIDELTKSRNINFSVGIYRDVAYSSDARDWLKYELAIQRNLDRRGIKWFIVKSHIDNLTASEVRSSWNDPHPGPKAISFIVSDFLAELR